VELNEKNRREHQRIWLKLPNGPEPENDPNISYLTWVPYAFETQERMEYFFITDRKEYKGFETLEEAYEALLAFGYKTPQSVDAGFLGRCLTRGEELRWYEIAARHNDYKQLANKVSTSTDNRTTALEGTVYQNLISIVADDEFSDRFTKDGSVFAQAHEQALQEARAAALEEAKSLLTEVRRMDETNISRIRSAKATYEATRSANKKELEKRNRAVQYAEHTEDFRPLVWLVSCDHSIPEDKREVPADWAPPSE
jgi:hypothetical protein